MPVRIGQVRRRKGSKQSSLAMICLAIGVVLFAFVVSKRSAPLEARENSTQIVAQYDTVPVPVPAEPVPAGVKLSKVRFVNIQFPRHQLPDGAITEIAAFRDSSTLVPLPARLPLFPENLSGEAGDSSNPVIERIPPGMRAMTVRVD
ncbi:MAG: hypothetical protein KDD42_07150, partial [Bdellovibrionales bacterium]|nr:hypothetical protein [Bdellovibrionales bacterium]